MHDAEVLAVEFESRRGRLMSVAYRLTGSVVDAEDAVSEAWLRLDRHSDGIDNLDAWLTTVVSRICIDHLTAAATRREHHVGAWLPEPVAYVGADDPLAAVVADEGARYAAMVVLDTLTPDARVAFVLHDAFDVPFSQIAEILSSTPSAVRQLAARARKTVHAHHISEVSSRRHDEIVTALVQALVDGDVDQVVTLIHPAARAIGDANGTTSTAVRGVEGPEKMARFIFGLYRKYGPQFLTEATPVVVNGRTGYATPGYRGRDGYADGAPRVTVFSVVDDKLYALFDVADPEKLRATPIAAQSNSPTAPGRHRPRRNPDRSRPTPH